MKQSAFLFILLGLVLSLLADLILHLYIYDKPFLPYITGALLTITVVFIILMLNHER